MLLRDNFLHFKRRYTSLSIHLPSSAEYYIPFNLINIVCDISSLLFLRHTTNAALRLTSDPIWSRKSGSNPFQLHSPLPRTTNKDFPPSQFFSSRIIRESSRSRLTLCLRTPGSIPLRLAVTGPPCRDQRFPTSLLEYSFRTCEFFPKRYSSERGDFLLPP